MGESAQRGCMLSLWRWLYLDLMLALFLNVADAAVLRTEPAQAPVVVAEYAHEPKTGWFLAPSSAPPAPEGVETTATAAATEESSSQSPLSNATVVAPKLWTPPQVLLVVRVKHVDYHELFQRPKLLFQFQRVIKKEITLQGGDDAPPSIELALSPGSVLVQAFISPAARPEPESESNKIDWVAKVCDEASLVSNIVKEVLELGDIGEVSAGTVEAQREACGVASDIGLLPPRETTQAEAQAPSPSSSSSAVLSNTTNQALQCRSLAPQDDCFMAPIGECQDYYDNVDGGRLCKADPSNPGHCDGFAEGFVEANKCEASTTTSPVVRWDDLEPQVQRALIAFSNSTDRHIAEASASITAASQAEKAGRVQEAFDGLPEAVALQQKELVDFKKGTDDRLKAVRDAFRFARVAAEKRSIAAATQSASAVSKTFEQEFSNLKNTGGLMEVQARQLDARAAAASLVNAQNNRRAVVARAAASKLAADADTVVMNATATSLLNRMNTSGQDAVLEADLVVQQAEQTMNLVMKTALIASNASDIALKAVQQATQNALKLKTIKKLVEKVTSAASATTNAAAAR